MALRKHALAARVADDYFNMSAEDREAWDEVYNSMTLPDVLKGYVKIWLDAIIAAGEFYQPGTKGGACSPEAKCNAEERTNDGNPLCCGTATPDAASMELGAFEQTGVCADSVLGTMGDGLGNKYTHVCGAFKLAAAAGAGLITAAYTMM